MEKRHTQDFLQLYLCQCDAQIKFERLTINDQSTQNDTIPERFLSPSFRQLIIQRIYVITSYNRGNRNSLSLNTNSSIAILIVTLVKPLRYTKFCLVALGSRFLPSFFFLLSSLSLLLCLLTCSPAPSSHDFPSFNRSFSSIVSLGPVIDIGTQYANSLQRGTV